MAHVALLASAIDAQAWQIFASLTVWATLLLGSAWILARLLGRASSAVRYCVWQFALVGLLVVPSAFVLLPGIPLGWWLEPSVREQSPGAEAHPAKPVAINAFAPSVDSRRPARLPLANHPAAPPSRPVERTVARSEAPRSTTIAASATPIRVSWSRLLAAVWTAGVVAQVAWLLWCLRRAARLVQAAEPLEDDRLRRIQGDVAQRLSLSRPVRLLKSPTLRVPVVVGVRRPAILLPWACDDWSDEKIRIALAHEFAHVERRDVFWQLAVRFAVAAYWFHPLVWLGVKRMRQERERACDDRVLSAGVQAIDYAAGLIDVAAALVGRQPRLAGSIGMAGRWPLEDRVRAILDRSSPRNPASKRARRLLLASTAALVLALGVLRPFSPVLGETAEQPVAKGAKKEPNDKSPAGAAAFAAPTRTRREDTTTKGSMLLHVVGPDGQPLPCAASRYRSGLTKKISRPTATTTATTRDKSRSCCPKRWRFFASGAQDQLRASVRAVVAQGTRRRLPDSQ